VHRALGVRTPTTKLLQKKEKRNVACVVYAAEAAVLRSIRSTWTGYRVQAAQFCSALVRGLSDTRNTPVCKWYHTALRQETPGARNELWIVVTHLW
jgi:hypothetical protein